jgi:hypothetical protein
MLILKSTSLLCVIALGISSIAKADQASQSKVVDSIYTEALVNGAAMDNLNTLVKHYPGRLSGSDNLQGAIMWGVSTLKALNIDNVYEQPVNVPHWIRGNPETFHIISNGVTTLLNGLALGGSASTPEDGLDAEVIEVSEFSEIAKLGSEAKGKIIFINHGINPSTQLTMTGYAHAVIGRSRGPAASASLGAVATLVRSMTLAKDEVPHTGATMFPPGVKHIPAAALSYLSADRLHEALIKDPHLKVHVAIHAQTLPDRASANVIGEIRGSEFPNQIIVVGGHLDSWDIAPGANDDGTGIVQSIEVLRLFKSLGLKPRHTIRCVLFVNEENGSAGANQYAAVARKSSERNIFAVESDAGGFDPKGFNLSNTNKDAANKAQKWLPLLSPHEISFIVEGGAGADVTPLAPLGTIVGELRPDSQRYFDYHHSVKDTLDNVNPRELELGAAALASLVWLEDSEGL